MPVYAYSNTPQAAQARNTTQPLIRDNFLAINDGFSINHLALDAVSDYGKHKYVSMPEQAASPGTDAHEGALFSAEGAVSGVTELCFQREGIAATGAYIEMTAKSGNYTYLPSGILLRWGNNTWTGDQTAVVANTPPYFTAVYSVQMTELNTLGYNRFIYYVSATVIPATRVDLRAVGKNASGVDSDVPANYLIIGI